MPDAVPVIASDAHLAHAGLVELVGGREVPCFESPERAVAIRRALEADGGYRFEEPNDHGPDPITAVHELELLDLVEHAWSDALAAGHDPARCLLPDTFLLRAYAGPMELRELPAQRHLRLGAACFDTATPIVVGTYDAARSAVDVALTALAEALDAIVAFGADAPLLVSLGFDTYHADPISDLALRTDDYARVAAAVGGLGLATVVLQEGGYAIDALGPNAVAFLGALRDA